MASSASSNEVAPIERNSALLQPVIDPNFSTATTPALSRAPSLSKEEDVEKAGQQTPTSEGEGEGSNASTDSAHADANGRHVTGLKWVLVCIALYISAFLYGLDTTIAADVQSAVIEDFGHVDQLAWIGSGFPLGSVSVILLVGNLYGHFNMKWIYVASVAMFEIGSTLCGAAPTMNAMIVGRVLAGAGGSGVYLGALNYFTMLTTPEERGFYISLTGFCWGIGAVLGPVIGGAFSVSSATWRWAFYINLVIGAAAAPVYIFFLPSYHPAIGRSVADRIEHFDFLGLFLIMASWILFTFGFTQAGGVWAWNDYRTIVVLAVWGVVLLATVGQQYFTLLTSVANRAFPGHLLKSRTQVLLFIGTAASTSSLFVVVYFLPIYFQFVHNDSAIQAAIRLLPYVVVTVVINVVAGKLLSTIKYYMPMYLIAGIFITLGGSLLTAYLSLNTSESAIYGFTVLIGIGTGLTIQIGYAVSTLAGLPENIGHAINFQNVSQIGSTVICLVIAGQVFQSVAVQNLSEVLEGLGFSTADIASAVAGAQSTLFQQLDGELRERAIGAIVSAMQKAFSLLIVAGGMMILAAAGMKPEKLFGEITTA